MVIYELYGLEQDLAVFWRFCQNVFNSVFRPRPVHQTIERQTSNAAEYLVRCWFVSGHVHRTGLCPMGRHQTWKKRPGRILSGWNVKNILRDRTVIGRQNLNPASPGRHWPNVYWKPRLSPAKPLDAAVRQAVHQLLCIDIPLQYFDIA